MRPPRRERGRYASMSGLQTVRGQRGDRFPLVVVDGDGLPVPHLTEYYRLRNAELGLCKNTNLTYLGHVLPVAGFFLERRWDGVIRPN